MAKILFDFDQILSNTQAELLRSINERFGTDYVSEEIKNWAVEKYLEKEHVDFMWGEGCFLSPHTQLSCKPIVGAIEGVESLLAAGHTGMVVSDRPVSLFESTRYWLDQYGLDTLRLLFTRNALSMNKVPEGLTKIQVARLHDLTVVIEDSPHHVKAFAKKSYIDRIFLLDMPYNQGITHEKIVRVDSWNEIVERMIET